MKPTIEQARTIVQVARTNPFLRQMENIYRMPDTEDGARCLAIVIAQGMERGYATSVETDMLVTAIEELWTADGWVKP